MRIRRWSGVLVAIVCLGVVVSVVTVMANVKIAQAEINKVDESMPKIFISLSDTTLEELNSGDKEEKFFDNDLKLIEGNDVSYFGSVEIKGRGNSTWNVEKKPYQIKFDKKVDFLGMGEARKWVLLANYYDHSSLRTDLAFYIARELDMNYAFDGRFADLYIDDEYVGLYYVTHAVEIGKETVDLREPKGVMVEVDNVFYEKEDRWYETEAGNYLVMKDIVTEDDAEIVMEDFKNSFEELERAVEEYNFAKVTEIVDVESFAKYYVLSELTGNLDAYITSFYLYKDGADDKIHAGPGWDFDAAFGNKNWSYAVDNGRIFAAETIEARREQAFDSSYPESAWISKIMYYLSETDEFHEMTCGLFNRNLLPHEDETKQYIQSMATKIRRAAVLNNDKWGFDDFDVSVEYLLKWTMKRFDIFKKICLPIFDEKRI